MLQNDASFDPKEWVDRHGDYLYRFALSRLRDGTEAEEAVQDALLASWKNRAQFQGGASERTWLTGILKNKIVDRFRRRSREAINVDDSIDTAELETLFDAQGHGRIPANRWTGNPDSEAEKAEFWAVFDECVGRLPERTAGVFVLRELDGLDAKEICKELDISSSNYWVRLHRARLKLRECLERNWFQRQDS